MKNYVIESYENYREEERLSTNNARRIEFLTTVRALDELIVGKKKILDCAAGTGVYAFYLADKGHDVTATDMSVFEDETFDVVLNMGPFYHLINEEDRKKCFEESLRVLKKGGLLITAYIPRYYVFQYVAMSNDYFLDANLAKQITETGVLRHDDEKCFWTDTYYSTDEEMENLYHEYGMEVIDHFAQDGATPHFSKKVDEWNEEQFKVWCDYHYSICRQKSLLGASNHVMIIGRK